MTYAFRLRFRTNKPFATDAQRITIPGDEYGPEFSIAATPEGTLRYAKWLSVRLGGFNSPEAAREHALKLKNQLLLVGTARYTGLDFGHDQVTTGRSHIEEQSGCGIRDNVHGIDVFEEDPERETRFFSVEAKGKVSDSPVVFTAFFQKARATSIQLTERQRITLELINGSLFPASSDAQLLIRVAAMEVLCEPAPRPEGLRALLSKAIKSLEAIEALTGDKQTVRGILRDKMKESIGQATRRHVRTLLGDQRLGDFQAIYKARNRLVHKGKGRGQNTEMAGRALFLAVDLAMAEIGFVPPEVTPNEAELPTADRPTDGDRQGRGPLAWLMSFFQWLRRIAHF